MNQRIVHARGCHVVAKGLERHGLVAESKLQLLAVNKIPDSESFHPQPLETLSVLSHAKSHAPLRHNPII